MYYWLLGALYRVLCLFNCPRIIGHVSIEVNQFYGDIGGQELNNILALLLFLCYTFLTGLGLRVACFASSIPNAWSSFLKVSCYSSGFLCLWVWDVSG